MPESIKMAVLQNAVKNIPQLSMVETLDDDTSTTSGNGPSTHLTYMSYTTSSSMIVLGMILPIPPLPLREGMYMQLTVHKIVVGLQNPTRHISLQTLIHLQMSFIRYIRPKKTNHHQSHYQDFNGSIQETTFLSPQETPKV